MLIKSIYTILFEANNKFYVYCSRSNFFSEISRLLFDAIENDKYESLPEKVVEELCLREVIVEEDKRYDYYYGRLLQFNAMTNNRSVLGLIIAPTTGCNFDCPYCFESKNNPKTLTDEVIEKVAKFVKDYKDANWIDITWYGGEPLIAFPKIKKLYEALDVDGMPKISSQSIVTNGYCFSDEVIDFFERTGCKSIQITIDGIGKRHDLTRRLKNSTTPTFDKIVSNIDRIADRLKDTQIHIRVNVNRDNYQDYVAVHNYFKNRYPDNNMISVYPGIIREETADKCTLCSSSFATSERLELHKLLRDAGIDTSDFPGKMAKGCMMHNQSSFLIGPEGEIYKCWNDVSNPDAVIGNVGVKELSNMSHFIKYSIRSVPFCDECRECHAFPICDGGCSYYRYRNMFEGASFDLCSPYRNVERLNNALLSGIMPGVETV